MMHHRLVSVLTIFLLGLLTGCSDDSNPLGFTSIEDEINSARPIPSVRVERPTEVRVFERPDDYNEAVAEDGQLVLGRPGTSPKYVLNLRTTQSVEITPAGIILVY